MDKPETKLLFFCYWNKTALVYHTKKSFKFHLLDNIQLHKKWRKNIWIMTHRIYAAIAIILNLKNEENMQ